MPFMLVLTFQKLFQLTNRLHKRPSKKWEPGVVVHPALHV